MEAIATQRADFNQLGTLYPPHADVTVQAETINGVSSHWFIPEGKQDGAIAIYLHGGGYIMGGIDSHKNMLAHVAAHLGIRVLLVEYRLAPEHPFPFGVEDAVVVYDYLVEQQQEIFIIGDSAGGGLTVAAIKSMTVKKRQLPRAVILLSPWIYLEADTPSYKINAANDPVLNQQGVKEYAELYRGSRPLKEVSYDDQSLQQFPPVLILVGSGEILLDDSRDFHASVSSIQPNSVLSVHNDATHVWLLSDIHSFHAKYALAQMKAFLSL
ncbi:alpha/beta hydrolase [Danxiaibacter flavus]|uniref:Alpha/beta hydrolase n=1 Tax=Danxiaibacter flavus TaxID=3049108 RepID=A0ABV3ZIE8_9BACT|nr:alpha/beta hydrolase [Chitinophagaceae bacterium DXS]